jgi:hypothetical protein
MDVETAAQRIDLELSCMGMIATSTLNSEKSRKTCSQPRRAAMLWYSYLHNHKTCQDGMRMGLKI